MGVSPEGRTQLWSQIAGERNVAAPRTRDRHENLYLPEWLI
jgi:hypothetical protein